MFNDKHMIIDLETFNDNSRQPGFVVAEIGWAVVKEERIFSSGLITPNLYEQYNRGLKWDLSTEKWWADQGYRDRAEKYRQTPMEDFRGVREQLERFNVLCDSCDYLWSWGSYFDFPTLDALYSALHVSKEYSTKPKHDLRIFRDLLGWHSLTPQFVHCGQADARMGGEWLINALREVDYRFKGDPCGQQTQPV